MKASEVFTSKYLRSDDLRGRDITVTIDKVALVAMPDGKQKPAVFFQGKEKALILNKTNFNTIASVTGIEDTDDWGGAQITIYPSETEFQGQMVDCIRVRRKKPENEWEAPPPQRATPLEPPPDNSDDIPF